MGPEAFLLVEPGIAAEYFIGAFAGQGHLVMLLDQRAEMQHGRIDVSHGGQIVGQHRITETVGLIGVAALQIVVVGVQKLHHPVHKRAVLRGLEGIGLEILIIVHKIKGKRGQFFPLFFKLRGADGGNQAGIHSPGEEGTDGNIGDHLAFDRVLNEKGRLLNGLFVAVLMRKAH